MATVADQIREFVFNRDVVPARNAGERTIKVKAGEVHSAMKLKNRMPAVASALGARTFETQYQVKCVSREGPHNGARLTFTFDV